MRVERRLGRELPGHRVELSREDMVTLKGEVFCVVKVLGTGGHLSDLLVVTSLD